MSKRTVTQYWPYQVKPVLAVGQHVL